MTDSARLARLDDAADIARIYNEGIEDRVATFETATRSEEQILKMLHTRGATHPTVVLEREGEIVAWAGASPYSARACYAGVAEFSVYTARPARGTGAGRAVLAFLIARCEEGMLWKLLSRVFVENVASRSLCRSLGFREVGVYRRHAQLDGEWRDVVIVELLLGAASTGRSL